MTRGPGLDSATGAMGSQPVAKSVSPASKAVESPLVKPRAWNTKHLGLRIASDLVSGAVAALSVAPLITVIDKLVMPQSIPRVTAYTSAEQLCKMPQGKPD